MQSNGNGFGIDPKWNSYIDTTVRETLELLGRKIHSLNVNEVDRWQAELATARALIYAACTVVWGYGDEDADMVKRFAMDSLERFTSGLEIDETDEE